MHSNPRSKGIYIVEYLFVVLSPCAFIAADYVLLGRLAAHLQASRHLLIPARRITLVFILSDVSTFLVQAGGGSSTISANTPAQIHKGENIFLVGLALQLLSFLIFTAVFLLFLHRVRKHDRAIWTKDAGRGWWHDWRTLAAALVVSCIGILVRTSAIRDVCFANDYRHRSVAYTALSRFPRASVGTSQPQRHTSTRSTRSRCGSPSPSTCPSGRDASFRHLHRPLRQQSLTRRWAA